MMEAGLPSRLQTLVTSQKTGGAPEITKRELALINEIRCVRFGELDRPFPYLHALSVRSGSATVYSVQRTYFYVFKVERFRKPADSVQ